MKFLGNSRIENPLKLNIFKGEVETIKKKMLVKSIVIKNLKKLLKKRQIIGDIRNKCH